MMGPVAQGDQRARGGKRKAPRRATPAADPRPAQRPGTTGAPSTGLSGRVLLLAAGVTVCVVAWGYLVYAAIDFGSTARAGDGSAWGLLVLAGLGAIACLFVALMLLSRLAALWGLGQSDREGPGATVPEAAPGDQRTVASDGVDPPARTSPATPATPTPRPRGGKRAAR